MGEDKRCKKCGCWEPICRCDNSGGVVMHVWKPMIYNDICETPLLIESKQQLKRECKKHGVIACRLL